MSYTDSSPTVRDCRTIEPPSDAVYLSGNVSELTYQGSQPGGWYGPTCARNHDELNYT